MIQIYSPGNTNFKQNGDMTLFPEICEASSELGGAWTLEITHPIDDEGRWKYIEKEAVLSVPTHMGEDQLYRIDEITDKNDADISAKAYPIFYDSAKEVFLMDKRPTAKNGQETLDILTEGTKYSGESNISTANTAYFVRRNLLDCILGDKSPSFVGVWGGEVLFDNFKIIVNERAGGDYGAEVRYGKNMVGVNVSEDMSEVVTRIVPVAYNGRLLTSQMVDSPLINNYAIPYTKEIKFEDVRYFEDIEEGTDTTDLIVCNSQAELDAALIAKCNEQFEAGIDLFKATIDVDMVALENTEEYKDFKDLVKIGLGDDVSCYHTRLGIQTKARAIKIDWDCITDSVKNVKLGDYQYDFLKKFNSTMEKVDNVLNEDGSVGAQYVKGILNAMNTQLRYQKNVAQKQEVRAILFEDLDPESPLYGAMAMGTQGFQISNKRTADGRDWDWSTAFTAKGGYADVLVAGILADKTGKTYWNLDTGEFVLSPETKITWGQVTDTDDVANKDDIPSDEETIVLIRNNRGTIITKEYIEALKIIAGSVAAEDITGKKITGKTLEGVTINTQEDVNVGNNINMNQKVNTSKIIRFNSGNYIENIFTGVYNYLNLFSDNRIVLELKGDNLQYTPNIAIIETSDGAYGIMVCQNNRVQVYDDGVEVISDGEDPLLLKSVNGVKINFNDNKVCEFNDWSFKPGAGWDGQFGLGKTYERWLNICSVDGVIQTSDEREKEDILPIRELPVTFDESNENILEKLFERLVPITYTMNGDSKLRIGFGAQTISNAMSELGLSEDELSLIEHSYWVDDSTKEEKDRYGLKYQELIPLNTHMIQKLCRKVAECESEIAMLKLQVEESTNESN